VPLFQAKSKKSRKRVRPDPKRALTLHYPSQLDNSLMEIFFDC